jgi:hypothetical protein
MSQIHELQAICCCAFFGAVWWRLGGITASGERSEVIVIHCRRRDSNPHTLLRILDFESQATRPTATEDDNKTRKS